MKNLFLFSTLLVMSGISIAVKAQTPPPECNRNNNRFAYSSGYSMDKTAGVIDYSGEIDSPQDIYDKYPPGQGSYANIDTEAEIECYRKGIVEDFEAAQN